MNEWLPVIGDIRVRSREEVKGKMSVMTALLNIAFNAPVSIVKNRIPYLSGWEMAILEKNEVELSEKELNALYWYLESLWALLYITKVIDALPPNRPVENFMANKEQ